jgi:hypothetical protein
MNLLEDRNTEILRVKKIEIAKKVTREMKKTENIQDIVHTVGSILGGEKYLKVMVRG